MQTSKNLVANSLSETGIPGTILNLTEIMNILARFNYIVGYGENTTVDYLSPYYKGISSIDSIPVLTMTGKDYLLFEITLDPLWLDTHNLIDFTPYIYYYNTIIWGSVDTSLFLSKKLLSPTNKINICCTACKEIGEKYSQMGYLISKLPIEYILNATISIFIRVSTQKGVPNIFNNNIKTSYYTTNEPRLNYYTSEEIIATYPPVFPAISNEKTIKVIETYNKIQDYFSNLDTLTNYETYPYCASYAEPPVSYAIQSFYDSIDLEKLTPSRTPLDLLANNTDENYYMTNPLSVDSNNYVYILYANQFDTGASCTSNIQIYNSYFNLIFNAIYTSADLPPMSSPRYPIPADEDSQQFPPYGLAIIPMSVLYKNSSGLDVIIVQRISFGLINANHIIYEDIQALSVYTGPLLTETNLSELKKEFPFLKITVYTDSK